MHLSAEPRHPATCRVCFLFLQTFLPGDEFSIRFSSHSLCFFVFLIFPPLWLFLCVSDYAILIMPFFFFVLCFFFPFFLCFFAFLPFFSLFLYVSYFPLFLCFFVFLYPFFFVFVIPLLLYFFILFLSLSFSFLCVYYFPFFLRFFVVPPTNLPCSFESFLTKISLSSYITFF